MIPFTRILVSLFHFRNVKRGLMVSHPCGYGIFYYMKAEKEERGSDNTDDQAVLDSQDCEQYNALECHQETLQNNNDNNNKYFTIKSSQRALSSPRNVQRHFSLYTHGR